MPAHSESHGRPVLVAMATPLRRQQRRARIITAATRLAAHEVGAVQIRQVADRAGVSPSTVYRYFSSKDDLLVACLHQWLAEISHRGHDVSQSTDPIERVLCLTERLTNELLTRPLLADAAARAYLHAHGEAAENAALCRNALSQMFTDALDHADNQYSHDIGDLIADVWSTNIPAIIQRRSSIGGLLKRLESAMTAIGLGPVPLPSARCHTA